MGPGTDSVGVPGRKGSIGAAPTTPPTSSTQMSFRLASEDELKEVKEESKENFEPCQDSTYGVKSLQDSIYEPFGDIAAREPAADSAEDGDGRDRRRSTLKPMAEKNSTPERKVSEPQTAAVAESLPLRLNQNSRAPSISHSITSLFLDSQAPLSTNPSSPKSCSHRSFRVSDEDSMDEAGSQAIVSSSEDETRPAIDVPESSLQLVMPSIKMPSRRPFTDRGKALGKLKVLIAGDSGAGKSSFIRSIVQTCEDIVHVDPLTPSPPSIDQIRRRSSRIKLADTNVRSTQTIVELFASTKAYPSWWSDTENAKVMQRRKGSGDNVLERNVCFVDTPGYSIGLSKMETIDSVIEYIEGQLKRSFSESSGEGNIAGLMCGNGGTQVDVVLYMVSQDLKHEDIVFLERLNMTSNVIILISKSDIFSPEETEVLRRSITERLRNLDIVTFRFAAENARQSPFSVCSAPSDDDENMDASLLMSPDYVQPLIPSELKTLIDQLFERDTASHLRHLAASKLVQAQRGSKALTIASTAARDLSNPVPRLARSPSSPSQATMTHIGAGMSPYIQARIADHTQQEEKLAQVRLAKWAADLQRSLQNERTRYEALAKGEQAAWLTEKLGDIGDVGVSTKDAALIRRPEGGHRRRKSGMAYQYGLLEADDPLGLLHWNEYMRQRGWVALQVAGGFGILGAVAVWVARGWSANGSTGDWSWPWWRDG